MLALAAGTTAMAMWVPRGQLNPVAGSESLSPQFLLDQVVKYLDFASEFGILHAWAPLHTALVYRPYDSATWRSSAFLLGLAVLTSLVVWAVRRSRAGKPGLLVALGCHLALAVPASGLFLLNFLPADRYTYGLTIVAAVVVSGLVHAWLRACEPAFARAAIFACLLGVTAACSHGLALSLEKWRHTVSLMEDLVATSQDLTTKLHAQLRIALYWSSRGDGRQQESALLQLLAMPPGGEGRRVTTAVAFTVWEGACEEARFLLDAGSAALDSDQQHVLRNSIQRCEQQRR